MFIKNGDPQPITCIYKSADEADVGEETVENKMKKVLDDVEHKETNTEKNGK